MNSLTPSWPHALRVWWAFTWRWYLIVLVGTLPVALLIGIVKPPQAITLGLISIWAPLVAILSQVEAMRRILRMDFPGYKVRLLERPPHE